MRRLLAAAAIAVATGALGAQQAAPQRDSIRREDLRADLFFLAGDGFRGRLTNAPENALAADWIRSRFERLGLAPAGDEGSFIQRYNLSTATLGEPSALALTTSRGVHEVRSQGQDFYPLRFSASASVTAPVVLAGFGIESPERGYSDYGGSAVRGAVVLVFDHEPGERDPKSPFDGVVASQVSTPIWKALAAQDHGAVGMLVVADVHNHPGEINFEASVRNYWPSQPPRIENYTLASWVDRIHIPVAQISPALAAELVRGANKSLEDLARGAETTKGTTPQPLAGTQVELTVGVNRHIVPDQNVLAAMDGSDARLKNEWVVICAHFDHNGADGAQVYNGADDDGSGTVGLLDIAEAFALAAQQGAKPRRSILLAAWNSEERGLLGAWAYTERPTVAPLDRIVAVLNMDMIGRNEEVPVGGGPRFRGLDEQTAESNRNATNLIGTTRSPELAAIVNAANAGIGLELKKRYDNNASNLMRRSDHWPFIQRGVPALWFHTGLHPDYHTTYDRPEKVNYEKMEKIVRLVYQAAWDVANGASRPTLTRAGTR